MYSIQRPTSLVFASLLLMVACSSSAGSGTPGGTGGRVTSGAGAPGSGGGAAPGSGGAPSASGGAPATGGASSGGTGVAGAVAAGSGGGLGGAAAGGSAGSPVGGAGGGVGTGPGGRSGGGAGGAGPTGGASPVVPCQMPIPVTTGTAATVTVDLATSLAPLSPDLLGVHTAVYSTSLSTSGLPQALKTAGIGSLRYPGGSYADIYFWDSYTAYSIAPAQGFGSNVISINPGSDFGRFIALVDNAGSNAFITVNYGSSWDGMRAGSPQAAAAWVAYANALPTNTTVIGTDDGGRNWGTAGDWAMLRASAPVAGDADHKNFLRISHPNPVGIRYWEVGNELFGNGFYQGGCGWEVDLHAPYPATGTNCTGRMGNAALGPMVYGTAVAAFSAAMKRVDPTIKVGAVLNWTVNAYANWDVTVLRQACESIDFMVTHWYGGTSVTDLLTRAHTDIPTMFRDLHALVTPANGCTTKTAATMPIAITEWGPNQFNAAIEAAINPPAPAVQSHNQITGIYVAEAYANLMEQGGISAHLAEMYPAASGIAFLDSGNQPYWGYHGLQMAHYLTNGGGTAVQATANVATVLPHAALRPDGGVNVMLTNTSTTAANVTVRVTGGTTTFACVGSRYAYTPAPNTVDLDGTVSAAQSIFATADGLSVPVGVPPYSIVVVSFPKK